MLKKHMACVHAEEMSFGGSAEAESTAIGSGSLCLNLRSYNVTGTSSAQHVLLPTDASLYVIIRTSVSCNFARVSIWVAITSASFTNFTILLTRYGS